jgi:uncharacterized protein (DUF885 family)
MRMTIVFLSFILLKEMNMKFVQQFTTLIVLLIAACNTPVERKTAHADEDFSGFETRFLDRYWNEYPSQSITIGYGKYYDKLVIPDSPAFAAHVQFSRAWIDSLNILDYNALSDNNKISFNIIKNQLESDIWYQTVLNPQQWDAAPYNLSNDCYYIINQPYAPLDDRLRILSKRLENAEMYYEAAYKMLNRPTRESIGLAVMQNKGGLSIFGKDLTDSIKSSHLTDVEKNTLNTNVSKTVKAINIYVDSLNKVLANKNYIFRKFSIGKDLFSTKFKYDLVTNFTPEEIYGKALAEKKSVTARMFRTSDSLWTHFYNGKPKPKDSLILIKSVIDAISLDHAKGKDFFDTLRNQVYELKRFIIMKDLFDFDTSYPIIVRLMPEYARGFALANAEFTPPYQKSGETYFNIDDVTKYPPEKMESTLREVNKYASQLLSIHEAIPGHHYQMSLQMEDSLLPQFRRFAWYGAYGEGWALYSESLGKELGLYTDPYQYMGALGDEIHRAIRLVVDVAIHQKKMTREEAIKYMMDNEAISEQGATAEIERYIGNPAQALSYKTGAMVIRELRTRYTNELGNKFNIAAYHDEVLKDGCMPLDVFERKMNAWELTQ